ncbi:MAG: hypothetical protein GVY24_03675 [Planctomycetes bacterium]|jgi:predicted GH43/DUF377 family glycosyl hydrolase|nr:hypothetical protein [Planctomycetota bacterium]
MLERQFTEKVLSPADLKPSQPGLKVIGVFNPGVVRLKQTTYIIARVVEQPTETREDCFPSPRMIDGELTLDWLGCEETDAASDPRTYTSRIDGSLRLRFISHLRVFTSKDGIHIDNPDDAQQIMPRGEYETYGIEDPRITVINGTAYITYVVVSGHGVATALLSTTDFQSFHRHGIIFCPDNKDVVLFPEKILGDFVALHRPMPSMKFSPPRVWLARSPDLYHWGAHLELLDASGADVTGGGQHRDRIGGGTPPLRTDRGWLTIYHGSDKKPGQAGAGRYTAGALLLDLENPSRVISRTPEPIMVPTEPYEREGFVNNIVFPTAVVEDGDQYLVYGGAADENLTVVGYEKQALLATLP